MTAPARTRTSASGTSTTEREHFPPDTKKTAQPRTRGGSGTATRSRSAAAERAYARREERRERSLRRDQERPNRAQRPVQAPEPRRQRVRQPTKRLQEKVAISRAPLVVGGMSLLATGLAGTLWLAIAAVSGSYQIQQAQAEVNALTDQKNALVRQNSDLDSTPALQRRAIQQGLVPAPEPAHLVPQPNGSVVVVGDPQAAVPRAPAVEGR
jgi:hypothetical protein